MDSNTSSVKKVSDTAFWVAYYRAVESKKKNPLFRDPLADLLTGEYGEKVSNSMKSFERYAYWNVTIRTRLIDEYILKYISQGYKTIINIGAGLDTRPYRLTFPSDVHWIEIDFPYIIELKNEKLKNQKPKCKLQRTGLNLTDQVERAKLFRALNHRVGPALILTEGVIPYLTEDSVSSLAKDIKDQSNFKLWLAEYYSPEVYPRYQSLKFRNLLGDAPFQFFPEDWFSFFEDCGWTQKEMQYLHDEAEKHNRKFPLPWWATILRVFIGEKRIMRGARKFSAYIVFEKNTVE
ncbi:class I SAM-dependent methyltransferase [Sulfurirhabdus autotrophica]|uniref:S-adenosyl-L-methionine-dependent methyltransferase n=1 Tax=Sulfurirhabdus autotrophica TaxID=1706046 RepID=A0A4R3XNP8_9PROT|nr:SAM-dependent methyltransferase [Sulfurirhabdus autotrophica]TCV79008.1 methyltransferase (TIGR00027 family) [Sulfurirhabdus autotrophica]